MGIYPPSSRVSGPSGAPFDSGNSFPVLGGAGIIPSASRNSSYGNPNNSLSSSLNPNPASMYGAGQMRAEEDFTIENENFPALPGGSQLGGGGIQKHHGDLSSAVVGGASLGAQGQAGGRDLGLVGGGLHSGAGSAPGASASQSNAGASAPAQEYGGAFGSSLGTSGLNIGSLLGSQLSSINASSSSPSTANTAEVKFGLSGLLDIIRMTDKVRKNMHIKYTTRKSLFTVYR